MVGKKVALPRPLPGSAGRAPPYDVVQVGNEARICATNAHTAGGHQVRQRVRAFWSFRAYAGASETLACFLFFAGMASPAVVRQVNVGRALNAATRRRRQPAACLAVLRHGEWSSYHKVQGAMFTGEREVRNIASAVDAIWLKEDGMRVQSPQVAGRRRKREGALSVHAR